MSTKASTVLEIISAVAVVISLIFVGFEIRNSTKQMEQNTQALQIAAYQDLIGRIVEMNAIDIENNSNTEDLLAIKKPTKNDISMLYSRLWIVFRHGDLAYFQFEKGAISKLRLDSALAPLTSRLHNPRVLQRWHEIEMVFVPTYRAYINSYIQNNIHQNVTNSNKK